MIWIAGAGAFGSALAVSMAQLGPVCLWSHDPKHVGQMCADRENKKRLSGFALPESIEVSSRLDPAKDDIVLLAIPTQKLRGFLKEAKGNLRKTHLVACCKGMEVGTGLGPTQIISEAFPKATIAILTGPSFAADIARGLPTALTLGCASVAAGTRFQTNLSTPNIRIYRTSDVTGAELGGALKNVIAIACGVAIGAGLGDSARAALMTRGFAEIVRVAEMRGALRETLTGLSGFGDLVLTCTSDQSRNYQFGLSIGQGFGFDTDVTVEGAATARAMVDSAADLGVDLPVTRAVCGLVQGELKVADAMAMLFSRPLKYE